VEIWTLTVLIKLDSVLKEYQMRSFMFQLDNLLDMPQSGLCVPMVSKSVHLTIHYFLYVWQVAVYYVENINEQFFLFPNHLKFSQQELMTDYFFWQH